MVFVSVKAGFLSEPMTKYMKTKMKSFLLVGSLGVVAFLSSCQSQALTAAVACSKCKTVWVKTGSSGGKGNPIVLRSAGAMNCPDCENKATPFFKGMTANNHTCKSCGGTVFHCR